MPVSSALRESPPIIDRFVGLTFRGVPAARPPILVASSPGTAPIHPPVRGAESCADEERSFLELVLAQGGRSLGDYRLTPLTRRLPACFRALHVDSIESARRTVEANPESSQKALDALLIGATSFYRDAPVFDFVRDEVLPKLFAGRDRVRILSAACSDGAEPYTIAMLADAAGRLADAEVWGVDCRASAIETACRGVYSANAVRHLPQDLRDAGLEQGEVGFRVVERLRKSLRWSVASATAAATVGSWDAIFCRNLAIYLEPAASRAMWGQLVGALKSGGYLIVGKAEKPEGFGLVRVGPCTYRKP